MNFLDARHSARMSKKEVANYLKLSMVTVYKYERTGKAPKAVIECLLMIAGYCPTFSLRNDFSGWSFSSGFLYSPEGDRFTSGDVRAGRMALVEINRLHRFSVRRRQEKKKKRNTAVILPFKQRVKAKKRSF